MVHQLDMSQKVGHKKYYIASLRPLPTCHLSLASFNDSDTSSFSKFLQYLTDY